MMLKDMPMRPALMAAATLLTAIFTTGVAFAKRAPVGSWQVTRTIDPITSKSSCIVAALDRAGGLTFSRVGALYPFVERDPDLGLLVGVSSGGRVRIPTGDIVWRVDDHPFRTLRAANNPAPSATVPADAAGKAIQDMMALSTRLTAASTVASGETARQMLAEMMAGNSLIYRSASATPAYGLPSAGTNEVGQITKDGLKPFPLDDSFRQGLASCGIAP